MPTTQASIRRVPDPWFVQPLRLGRVSVIEQLLKLFSETDRVSNVLMLRLAVGLTPVDCPNTTDTRGIANIVTPVGSPDIDILDLDWHVHARIHVGPVLRYVL